MMLSTELSTYDKCILFTFCHGEINHKMTHESGNKDKSGLQACIGSSTLLVKEIKHLFQINKQQWLYYGWHSKL